MEKIPTAEEVIAKMVKFDDSNDIINCTVYSLSKVMIEFAKIHVEAALKEASETKILGYHGSGMYERDEEDKDSIVNSYAFENIK